MKPRRALCLMVIGLVACLPCVVRAEPPGVFVVRSAEEAAQVKDALLAGRQHGEITNYVEVYQIWIIDIVWEKTWNCYANAFAMAWDLGGVNSASASSSPLCPATAHAPPAGGWLFSPNGWYDAMADAYANVQADCTTLLKSTVGVSWTPDQWHWGGAYAFQHCGADIHWRITSLTITKTLIIIIRIPAMPADVPTGYGGEPVRKHIVIYVPQLQDWPVFEAWAGVDELNNLYAYGDLSPEYFIWDEGAQQWVCEYSMDYAWPSPVPPPDEFMFDEMVDIDDDMDFGCCPCVGDLSKPCNDFVNVTDFTLFADAYGSATGDPNYNPCADFNGNGYVNVTDFTIFADQYGQPCPHLGACCLPDGTCEELMEPDCIVAGGEFQGEGTTCDPNPCPQPGACCFGDGSCEELTVADCLTAGGVFYYEGISCDPNPCPQPGPGENCSMPIPVVLPAQLPFNDVGYFYDWWPDYDDTCLGDWDAFWDGVYEVSVTDPVDIKIVVQSGSAVGVALDDSCPPDHACIAVGIGFGYAETPCVHLEPGLYYLLLEAPVSPDYYELLIEACTPEPGEDCSNPIVISIPAELPLWQSDSTCNRLNDYSDTCLDDYDEGGDILYRLDVTETTCVDIWVCPRGSPPPWAAIDELCPPGPGTSDCIAKTTPYSGCSVMLDLTLEPGTYYMMVDSEYSLPPGCGEYDLYIDPCP